MQQPVIIPAILTNSLEEFTTRLLLLHPLSSSLHIDYMDGTLTDRSTCPLEQISSFCLGLTVDIHLMVQKPADYLSVITAMHPARVILHEESFANSYDKTQLIKNLLDEEIIPVMTAWPSATTKPDERIYSYQIMGVVPGKAGQIMLEDTAQRALALKQELASGDMISVDGGVTAETIKLFKNTADTFVVNSYLSGDDLKKKWELLHKALK